MNQFVITHITENDFQYHPQQNNNNKYKNLKKVNLKNSFHILNNLYDSVKQDLSQSVRDLTNCFICLCPVTNPLSCPKCNNFACQACLKKYFNNTKKSCPLCKSLLFFNDWKINKTIDELEKILNKKEDKKKKAEELSKFIERKKKEWNSQAWEINAFIDRINIYRGLLEEYKTAYKTFFTNCQSVIDKAIEKYYNKIEELKKTLLSYNESANKSIIKLDNIINTNQNDYYSNNAHIKNLINELLSMERKHFNEKNSNDIEKFLESPIKLEPILDQFNLIEYPLDYFKPDKDSCYSIHPKHNKLGQYFLIYDHSPNKEIIKSKLSFKLGTNTNACFLVTQAKVGKIQKFFPMKLKRNEGGNFEFECEIPKEEFPKRKEEKIKMNIDVMMFKFEN